jgi:hypothetical protein
MIGDLIELRQKVSSSGGASSSVANLTFGVANIKCEPGEFL